MNLYNNLRTKVYLGLILALVSIPVHASLETWALKNDLTIPSLEMPSTSVLDSKDKQEIMMGLTCCYRKELINSVQIENSQKLIGLMSKERVTRSLSILQLHEPVSDLEWATFVSLQLLDIYTTYKGLKYDCVKELNPILGESPSVGKMFLVKTAVLMPAIEHDRRHNTLNSKVFSETNFLMSIVVANNIDAMQQSKKYCKKR